MYEGLKDRLYGTAGEWNLRQCRNPSCGLAWLDPGPAEESLAQIYHNYHTHQKHDAPGFVKHLPTKIYKLLLFNFWRGGLLESCFAGCRPGKLLDVGCGGGEFMSRMQRKGWEVEGIDVDAKAAQAAMRNYGFNVRMGRLEEMNYQESSFDAINLRHVIEHVHDPEVLLSECLRVLKPGGLLVSMTPNVNSFGHRRFRSDWRGLEPPRHIYLYTERSLIALAEKAGFIHIRVFTSGANALVYYLASMDVRQHQNFKRSAPLSRYSRATLFRFREWLLLRRKPGMGEEIVLKAIK